MPPKRRNPGPPHRRPKIAGASRARTEPGTNPATRVPEQSDRDTGNTADLAKTTGPTKTTDPDTAVDLEKKVDPQPPVEPVATYPDPTDPDPGNAGPTDSAHAEDDESSGPTWKPVVLVGAAAVVLGAFAVVAALRPGASDDNLAWVDRAETAEVTEAAAHAIEAMHGYNFETIDEDFAEIRELLTDERREEFDSTAQVTKDAAVQTRTVTEVSVAHIGASMIDESHAEVAAYINVSATGDGVAQGSAAAPMLVRMEKSDGRWLVSEIRDR